VLGFLAYLGSRFRRPARALAVLGLAFCLAAMAWARLYQGEHWLSQLLGGLSLGSFWLAVTILVYQRFAASRRGA
jgi:membrane-associated phospholipid phosphatase